MSFNIGLKLWSTNTDHYFKEAKRLYQENIFDYIELYVVPDTLHNLEKWQTLNIPFTLHAPHSMHGANLADKNKFEYNQDIYSQVETYRQTLNAKYTVVHAGIEGNIEETVRQLKIISPENILIENKPYVAPLAEQKLCRGATVEEIQYVLSTLSCGFCLDIGHAICTANSLGIEPYSYITQFNSLSPKSYHLSDIPIDSLLDQHLHLGKGSLDFSKFFSLLTPQANIVLEVQKNNKQNLNDFIEDVYFLRTFI